MIHKKYAYQMISRSHQHISEMKNPLCDTKVLTPMARYLNPLNFEVASSHPKCASLAINSALYARRSRMSQRKGAGKL